MPGTTDYALSNRKRTVFNSVFYIPHEVRAKHHIDHMISSANFGVEPPFRHDRSRGRTSQLRELNPTSKNQATWEQSWDTVISKFSLTNTKASILDQLSSPLRWDISGPGNSDFLEAVQNVLSPETRLPHLKNTPRKLLDWHSQQVRQHYFNQVLPLLLVQVENESDSETLLSRTIQILDLAHSLYLNGMLVVTKFMDVKNPGISGRVMQRLRQDLHAVISNSLPEKVVAVIKDVLLGKIDLVLGIKPPVNVVGAGQTDDFDVPEVRRGLLQHVEALNNVGLGGEKFQILFAELMNDAMTNYVQRTYGGVWSSNAISSSTGDLTKSSQHGRRSVGGGSLDSSDDASLLPRVVNTSSPSHCVRDLCEWIENKYSRLTVEVLSKLGKTQVPVAWTDVEKWKEMSIGRLASLRTSELFDIVANWPNSNGALDDLRTAVTTPQRRLQLTDVFSADLQKRLLHAGASTLQILRTYISMIWSFHALDHSKVLLDRVAFALQQYLFSRDDTVRIIITGLLSDTQDDSGNPISPGSDKLVELAILLNGGSEELGQRADEELDWNDMDWVPDPVDAGPGYKRSKSADIIGTLIGVLGSQEVFIKEFQNILGENLLKQEGDFEKEVKLLELLKTRFGEAPLQACEVMMKDIQDSRRVNSVIRRGQRLDPSNDEIAAALVNTEIRTGEQPGPEGLMKPSLHAKILSRLFWPQLHEESYIVPRNISKLQQSYEQGFESLKNARKLTWLHTLGQATVELDLRDRVVYEEVHTWQATVIWAFQGDGVGDDPVTRSVEELLDRLEMEESLLRSALNFWVGKMVIQEIGKNKYAVLETLNQEDRERSNAQAAAAAAATESGVDEAALVASGEISAEKMQMYWQFIQGMLKNSAAQMPLQQIAMMLKMLIVEGFPYSNEELQEFLSRKVVAGELELNSGKYKLKK